MGERLTPSEKAEMMERVHRGFILGVPHNVALGMRLLDFDRGRAIIEVPYDEKLVGNPETGWVHGGVVTTLIDSACGCAIIGALNEPKRVATLDLRIDYLKPAEPGRAIRCDATCYKVTREVAFVRAVADHGEGEDPIATAAGTFAIFHGSKRGPSKGEPSA